MAERYPQSDKLQGTRLPPVRFRKARIMGADLSSTNLTDADLRGSDLSGAVLRHANMLNARLEGTVLVGADLTGVRNLTREQLAAAIVDETTKLPDYLSLEDIRAAAIEPR